MSLVLNIYTNDELKEIKRVAEAERLKIPYRVAIYIIGALEDLDLDNDNDLIKLVSGSIDKLDKIIKATFKVSESELDCIDGAELVSVGVELFKWGMDKVKDIKGEDSKNVMETV